ncbi:MAG: hypothetical protein H7837_13060 [Magnetococcus sp. MYC-9]
MPLTLPHGTLAASTARINGYFVAAALFLCVTVWVGVAATALFLQEAMEANARRLLAADLRLQAALPLPAGELSTPLPTTVAAFASRELSGPGRLLSPSLEFSAMARVAEPEGTALVEVKAVTGDYPLRGRLELEPAMPLAEALSGEGVVVEKGLLSRMGVAVGATLWLGEAPFTITATLAYEPDRITHLFRLGPRVLIPLARVGQTGLLQAGSRVTQVLSVRLAEGENAQEVARTLRPKAQAAAIRILTPEQSQPSVRRFVHRFALFLALTSLLTLLVGGVAMAMAMGAYLRESRQTIATLKLLGAETGQIILLVLWKTLGLTWPASLAGALLGVLLPGLLPHLLDGLLPAETLYRPSPWLLLAGILLGILFSLLCAVGPLWWTRSVSPALLFRTTAWGETLQESGQARWLGMLALLIVGCASAGVAYWSADGRLGGLFAAGVGGMFLLSWAMTRCSLWGLRRLTPDRQGWGMAVRTLLRRGETQSTVLISLGMGLGLVSALFFLEDALHQQIVQRVPQKMPSFFFIDIQSDQVTPFLELAQPFAADQAGSIRLFPTLRGRLLSGEHYLEEDPNQPQSWRKAREYVLSSAEQLPAGNRILAGGWWSGPEAMEASVEVEMAKGLGLGVGDEIAFVIQGATVKARIANLRSVRWSDLGLNFFVLFSPAVLRGMPVSHMASVVAPETQEEALLTTITHRLHNVTAVATRVVLESVQALLHQLAHSVRLLGGAAVAAGLLVLAVSVAASRRQRRHAIALYRLLGAGRTELVRMAAAESALLGGLAATQGVIIGQLITALAIEGMMNDVWSINPWLTLSAFAGGALLIFLTGWIGSYRDLDKPVMVLLRQHGGS